MKGKHLLQTSGEGKLRALLWKVLLCGFPKRFFVISCWVFMTKTWTSWETWKSKVKFLLHTLFPGVGQVLYWAKLPINPAVLGAVHGQDGSLQRACTHPWVQFGWHGWHSRSSSAYLKMKLLAPCKPSGHFSTQFGPSLKWKHFVQWSGPWGGWKKEMQCIEVTLSFPAAPGLHWHTPSNNCSSFSSQGTGNFLSGSSLS